MFGKPHAQSRPEMAGRRVLVTGAGSGMATAALLLGHGGWVAAVSADPVALAAMERSIPMGRLGEPREIGELISFLLTDRAAFITGQVVCADGGFTAR